MSRHHDSLIINPLFLDALSGDIYPNPNDRSRVSTLGRMGLECFQEGDILLRRSDTHRDEPQKNGTLEIRKFQPLWYPGLTIETDTRTPDSTGQARLYKLALFKEEEGVAMDESVFPIARTGEHVLRVISNALATPELPYPHGVASHDDFLNLANAAAARSNTTQAAQAFFDKFQ